MQVIKPFILSFTWLDFVLCTFATWRGLSYLNASRKAKSPIIFRKNHIAWHLFSGSFMAYLIYVEHLMVNQQQHPFYSIIQYITLS